MAKVHTSFTQVEVQQRWEVVEYKYFVSVVKGRVGKFEKPARDTLVVIFHGMLLTSR